MDGIHSIQQWMEYTLYRNGWNTPRTAMDGIHPVQKWMEYTLYRNGWNTPRTEMEEFPRTDMEVISLV